MSEIATWYCRRCFEPFGPGTVVCPQHQLKLVEVKDPGTSIVGQLVDGKYKVESVLGIGGMGTVFRARQMPIEREVALKILNLSLIRDKTGVKRFIQEAQAASMLKSRYSAMVYDFGLSYEGYLYFTMELVGGRLLSEVLQEEKRLPVERTLHVAIDVCRSLEEAHNRGIIHRDIKPGNIMLSELDGHEIAKVLDFGTAELMSWKKTSKLTDLGKVHGTAEYMSPEQAQAKPVTVGTDFYSLGITIYEMLSGQPPFTGPAAIPVLLSHVNETPRPVSLAAPEVAIPPELDELVLRLLRKAPETRFDSAQELRYRLEDILGEVAGPLSGGALRLHLARPDVQPRRRNIVIFDTAVQRHSSRRVDEKSEHVVSSRPIQQTMTLDPQQLWREAEKQKPQPVEMLDPGMVVPGPSTAEIDEAAPRMGGTEAPPPPVPETGPAPQVPRTIIDAADAIERRTPTVPDMPAARGRGSRRLAVSLAATLLGLTIGGAVVLLYPEFFGFTFHGGSDTTPSGAVQSAGEVPAGLSDEATRPASPDVSRTAAPGKPTATEADVHPGTAVDARVATSTDPEVPTAADTGVAAARDAAVANVTDATVAAGPDAAVATATDAAIATATEAAAASARDAAVAAATDAAATAAGTVPATATDAVAAGVTDAAVATAADAAVAKKKAEDEAAAKKKAEDEAAAKKTAENEAAARKKAEDEAARKKAAGRTDKQHHGKTGVAIDKKQSGKETIKFSEEDLQ